MKGLNNYARTSVAGRLSLPLIIVIIFNLFLRFFSSAEPKTIAIILWISIILVTFLVLYVIFLPYFMNREIMIRHYDEFLHDAIKSYVDWAQSLKDKIESLENTDVRKFIIGKKYSRQWDPTREEKLIAGANINKEDILQEHHEDLERAQEQLNYYREERQECAKFLEKFHKASQQI